MPGKETIRVAFPSLNKPSLLPLGKMAVGAAALPATEPNKIGAEKKPEVTALLTLLPPPLLFPASPGRMRRPGGCGWFAVAG